MIHQKGGLTREQAKRHLCKERVVPAGFWDTEIPRCQRTNIDQTVINHKLVVGYNTFIKRVRPALVKRDDGTLFIVRDMRDLRNVRRYRYVMPGDAQPIRSGQSDYRNFFGLKGGRLGHFELFGNWADCKAALANQGIKPIDSIYFDGGESAAPPVFKQGCYRFNRPYLTSYIGFDRPVQRVARK